MFPIITAMFLSSADLPSCSSLPTASLQLPFAKFDQDPAGGWRILESMGCQSDAADLIRAYRQQAKQRLTSRQDSLLFWHEGQMRAIAGEDARAVPLLLKGVPEEGDVIDFTDYALGTVAFLMRDRKALISAARRLERFSGRIGSNATMAASGLTLHQVASAAEANLRILQGLQACWGKPYRTAYNCRAS